MTSMQPTVSKTLLLSEHDNLLLVLIQESLEYRADAVDRAVLVGRRRGRMELC